MWKAFKGVSEWIWGGSGLKVPRETPWLTEGSGCDPYHSSSFLIVVRMREYFARVVFETLLSVKLFDVLTS